MNSTKKYSIGLLISLISLTLALIVFLTKIHIMDQYVSMGEMKDSIQSSEVFDSKNFIGTILRIVSVNGLSITGIIASSLGILMCVLLILGNTLIVHIYLKNSKIFIRISWLLIGLSLITVIISFIIKGTISSSYTRELEVFSKIDSNLLLPNFIY